MSTTALHVRRWLGSPRSRHEAERELAAIQRRHAARRLDAAVRTLEARGHDVAGALRGVIAAERSLTHLMDSPVGRATGTCDRNAPISIAADLLGMAEHDLRVGQKRRMAAADRVAYWRQMLETATAAEHRALSAHRSPDLLAAADNY